MKKNLNFILLGCVFITNYAFSRFVLTPEEAQGISGHSSSAQSGHRRGDRGSGRKGRRHGGEGTVLTSPSTPGQRHEPGLTTGGRRRGGTVTHGGGAIPAGGRGRGRGTGTVTTGDVRGTGRGVIPTGRRGRGRGTGTVIIGGAGRIGRGPAIRGGIRIGGVGRGRRRGFRRGRGWGRGWSSARIFGWSPRWRYASFWGDPDWGYRDSRWIIRNETDYPVIILVNNRERYLLPGQDIMVPKNRDCFFTAESELGSYDFVNCSTFLRIIEVEDEDGNPIMEVEEPGYY